MVGKVEYTEIPKRLAHYDIGLSYIPCTPWFNNQPPLKTLEYMSVGLITVATKTAAHTEIWDKLPTELLTDDSVEGYSMGIQYAIDNVEIVDRESLRKVASLYSWNNLVKNKIIPLYQVCLEYSSQN